MSDLFSYLRNVNDGNYKHIDNMTDDELKKISPYVLTMWGNGAVDNNEIHTIVTNAYYNDKVFSLSKHPKLLLKLFMAANTDIDNTRYQFRKATGSSEMKKYKAIGDYYNVSLDVAKQYATILEESDIKDIVELFEQKEK